MCIFCLIARSPVCRAAATTALPRAATGQTEAAARTFGRAVSKPTAAPSAAVTQAAWASSTAADPVKPLHPAFGEPGRFQRWMGRGPVICGEGYLFELERRGYIQVGPFVPTVVLDEPEAVKQLHREFLRAGSDVIEAFTYYGHRAKMRLMGVEHLLEPLNRRALTIAQEVALEAVTVHGAEEPALVAGNVCNSTVWKGEDEAGSRATCKAMFDEQIGWAVEHGVDLVIGETFDFLGEAMTALEAVKGATSGDHTVPTMAVHQEDITRDGYTTVECLNELKKAGATVVGLNCARGPGTMLELLQRVCDGVPGPIAALPVAYRTDEANPTFQSLSPIDRKYTDLDPFTCTRYDFEEFTRAAVEMGVGYLGVCCGGAPHHVRAIANALGRSPPAAAFNPDLSKHFSFGTKEGLGELADEKNLGYRDTM